MSTRRHRVVLESHVFSSSTLDSGPEQTPDPFVTRRTVEIDGAPFTLETGTVYQLPSSTGGANDRWDYLTDCVMWFTDTASGIVTITFFDDADAAVFSIAFDVDGADIPFIVQNVSNIGQGNTATDTWGYIRIEATGASVPVALNRLSGAD
jgi:hypothetical protein